MRKTRRSLSELRPTAPEVLAEYTSARLYYAFNTYDRQGEIDSPLSPADVLMANLLSLELGWQEVIPLFAEGEGPEQRLRYLLDRALNELRDAQPFESYETYAELEETVPSLAAANAASDSVPQWTPTTVSKVLHRRRPHIVPLNDSYVRAFYAVTRRESAKLRKALWEDIRENADWMIDLAGTKTTPDGRCLSLLRLADILIWMDMKSRRTA